MKYCPLCSTEFRDGIEQCSDCQVALVDLPPDESEAREAPKLVTVLETGDLSLLLATKSVLESTDIPYVTRGEGLQDLFGLGRLGTGFSAITGPAKVLVPETYAEEAIRLIEELAAEPDEDDLDLDDLDIDELTRGVSADDPDRRED